MTATRYMRTNSLPVENCRRASLHLLIIQESLNVTSQRVGTGVAALAILLQRLDHDPIQLAAQQPAQLLRDRPVGARRWSWPPCPAC